MTAAMRKADDRVRVVTLTPAEARAYCAVLRLLEIGELPTHRSVADCIGRSLTRAAQLIAALVQKGAVRRRGHGVTGLGLVARVIVRVIEQPPSAWERRQRKKREGRR